MAREASPEFRGADGGWAARLVVEEKWQKAKEVSERLKALYPEYVGPDNPYLLLAIVFRRLSDPAAEHKVLEELAMRDGDAITAYLRLMELDEAAGDWAGVAKNARRVPGGQSAGSDPAPPACRAPPNSLGQRDEALPAYRAVALLDDTDPAEVHYHLARLLRDAGKPQEARREVLRSLEEAPSLSGGASAFARTGRPGHRPQPPLHRRLLHRRTTTMTRRRLTLLRSWACWRSPPACRLAQPFQRVASRAAGRHSGLIPEDRAGVPNWKVDEAFKKDVFTFVRIEYDSCWGRRWAAAAWWLSAAGRWRRLG